MQAQVATRAEVFAALGVDEFPGDLIVLVDTSASMETDGLYGQVVSGLQPLLDTADPIDHVALITFDTSPAVRFSGKVGTGTSPTSQLPAVAQGSNTDIGAAIAGALDELERPDAAEVATIVLLTDGVHQPAAGSAYPETMGPGWDALRARAQQLTDSRLVRSYALALRDDTDAQLLTQAFPDATVIGLPAEQLDGYFERVREQARIDKARRLIEPDLQSTVSATWPEQVAVADEPQDVVLTLSSDAMSLPVTVSDLILEVTSGEGTLSATGLPASVDLAPRESVDLPVTLRWAPPTGFRFGVQEVNATGEVTVDGTVATPWQDVISTDLSTDTSLRFTGATTPVAMTGEVGWGWPTIIGILVVLLLILGLLWFRWATRNPKLRGQLVVQPQDRRPTTVRLGGRSQKLGKPQGLAGTGRVIGRKSTAPRRATRGGRGRRPQDMELVLTYGHTQKAVTKTLRENSSTTIEGVGFQYKTR